MEPFDQKGRGLSKRVVCMLFIFTASVLCLGLGINIVQKNKPKAGTVQGLCISSCFFIFSYTAEVLLLILAGAP